MLRKGYNPASIMRVKFSEKCTEINLSSSIKLMLTEPMSGQPDEEKEKIAEVLLKIIERAKSEREILEMAVKTFGTNLMTRAAKYLQSMEK